MDQDDVADADVVGVVVVVAVAVGVAGVVGVGVEAVVVDVVEVVVRNAEAADREVDMKARRPKQRSHVFDEDVERLLDDRDREASKPKPARTRTRLTRPATADWVDYDYNEADEAFCDAFLWDVGDRV